jgi:hypothetical protein
VTTVQERLVAIHTELSGIASLFSPSSATAPKILWNPMARVQVFSYDLLKERWTSEVIIPLVFDR